MLSSKSSRLFLSPLATFRAHFLLLVCTVLCIVSSGAFAEPTAKERHVDRLSILLAEHSSVSGQLLDAVKAGNTDDARMLGISLDALNREIAYVRNQPVYEDTSGLKEGRAPKPVVLKSVRRGGQTQAQQSGERAAEVARWRDSEPMMYTVNNGKQ
jgi:hypothetical protein